MAFGLHWEWRGFGGVNSSFADRFSKLDTLVSEYAVEDYYIYVPGLETNLKIRKGDKNNLKFKRPGKFKNNFEQWKELENEFFEFPIPLRAQNLLVEFLKSTAIDRTCSIPPAIETTDDYLRWLKEIGCQIIEVRKAREIKEWSNAEGSVMIEWTGIYNPQSIISISLESEPFEPSESQKEAKTLDLLKSVHNELELNEMPLRPKNYLEAVTIWANSNKI
ncbi:MAG: hypothetical protein ACNS64_03315 [Candidatus Halalkalibacterium sp. M3_1C_030]